MMDTTKFKTVGQWFESAKQEGYSVPLAMCQGLEKIIERHNVTSAEAFALLVRKKKILSTGKTYVYDLSPLD